MTTKAAIGKVLAGRRKPMRVPAIIEAAVPLATGLKGKTPGQHVALSKTDPLGNEEDVLSSNGITSLTAISSHAEETPTSSGQPNESAAMSADQPRRQLKSAQAATTTNVATNRTIDGVSQAIACRLDLEASAAWTRHAQAAIRNTSARSSIACQQSCKRHAPEGLADKERLAQSSRQRHRQAPDRGLRRAAPPPPSTQGDHEDAPRRIAQPGVGSSGGAHRRPQHWSSVNVVPQRPGC